MVLYLTNVCGCCGVGNETPIGWWQLVCGKEVSVMAN